MQTLAWSGFDASRPELARVTSVGRDQSVSGTQHALPTCSATEPVGGGLVRFSSGDFVADLQFDDAGFVVRYEGLAERIG